MTDALLWLALAVLLGLVVPFVYRKWRWGRNRIRRGSEITLTDPDGTRRDVRVRRIVDDTTLELEPEETREP